MRSDRDTEIFNNRSEAGQLLADQLRGRIGPDAIALGLTRGGVPVAFEVARALSVPLDLIVVARLGIPWQPETAMGALAEGGTRIIEDRIVDEAMVSPHDIDVVERHERTRLAERVERLRGGRPPQILGGRTVVIVDDGLATGVSARAACQVARDRGAGSIVVAVPIASEVGLGTLASVIDDVVALQIPTDFTCVGQGYRDFGPTDDDDVVSLLAAAANGSSYPHVSESPPADPSVLVHEMLLRVGSVTVAGRSAVPEGARDLVIVVHDSSKERNSARSRYLSRMLTDAGFATLLVDLLTRDEEIHGERYLAIPMLAHRLRTVTKTVGADFDRVDYLADGVAAAIALEAAAAPNADIHAVACLGGRPDLVARLGALRAPTLLMVGEDDPAVLRLNIQASERLSCPHRLIAVQGAGHRFREPGSLQYVSDAVCAWFQTPGDRHRSQPSRGVTTVSPGG